MIISNDLVHTHDSFRPYTNTAVVGFIVFIVLLVCVVASVVCLIIHMPHGRTRGDGNSMFDQQVPSSASSITTITTPSVNTSQEAKREDDEFDPEALPPVVDDQVDGPNEGYDDSMLSCHQRSAEATSNLWFTDGLGVNNTKNGWDSSSTGLGINTRNTTCTICIETFQEGDVVVRGWCNHAFHRDCILGWRQIKPDCPVCRQDLRYPKNSAVSSL